MQLRDEQIQFQLDCGTTVNIHPLDNCQQVFHDPSLSRLQPTNKTLRMFNQTELKPLGTVKIETLNPKTEEVRFLEYVVVNEGNTVILGAQVIQHFQLMSVNSDNIMSIADAPSMPPAQPNLIREFDDVFQGEGLLQEKLHLEVDKTVSPIVLPVRKVPFALKEPLKHELDRLVAKGIQFVASKRNGKIRLCIDRKPLNKALKHNRYTLPTIDDLLAKLTNAKVFTVADAKNRFWHVPLDDESSYLTMFSMPWSRYRWTRMPFGISPAPEEFQRRLDNALQGLDGVMPIFDDTLIFGAGNTETEAMADHDAKLRALMQCCHEKGIKLNKEKLKLCCKEVPFMGHIISANGLKADPTKIQGIQEMPTPSSKQDVKRLLGMANYLQRFTPNLSEVTAPFRDLLKEDNQFLWDAAQERSFQELKKTISEAPVLKFFDPNLDSVEIQCDASDRGLGCCIMQNGQPCA